MRRERFLLLVGGVAALCCALAAAAVVVVGPGTVGDATRSPIAVVLVPRIGGSDLVSVELDSGRVIRRTRLRSLATDMEADPSRGVVVAAQTGGVAGAADDAVSMTEPWAGTVEYVKLPRVDPSQVECVAGRAMILHAVVDERGFVACAVDLGSRGLLAEGRVPDGTGLWAAAGGAMWTATPTEAPGSTALLRIDPITFTSAPGPALRFTPYGVAAVGDDVLVLGATGGPDATIARVALVDGTTLSVETSASVPGLPHGAQMAAAVEGLLVIGDWNGEAPETGSLAILEAATLRRVGTIDVGGAPCALASYSGRLLVVDRVSGTLSSIDPRTGVVRWRSDLGEKDLVCSKVVVLPYAPASHSSTALSTP